MDFTAGLLRFISTVYPWNNPDPGEGHTRLLFLQVKCLLLLRTAKDDARAIYKYARAIKLPMRY